MSSKLIITNAAKVLSNLPNIQSVYRIVLTKIINGNVGEEGYEEDYVPYYLFDTAGVSNIAGSKIIWLGPNSVRNSLIVDGQLYSQNREYFVENDVQIGVNDDGIPNNSVPGGPVVANSDKFRYIHPDGRTIDFVIEGVVIYE